LEYFLSAQLAKRAGFVLRPFSSDAPQLLFSKQNSIKERKLFSNQHYSKPV
jgi:hypothetical protein